MQAKTVATEEQVLRLTQLHAMLGASTSRLRILLIEGDDRDRIELVKILARCDQVVSDLLASETTLSCGPVFNHCREHLDTVRVLANQAGSLSDEQRSAVRQQSSELRQQLEGCLTEQTDSLVALKSNNSQHRQFSRWVLVGGHLLMLGMVGLLYFARQSERRLRKLVDQKLLEVDQRFALVVRGSADGILLTDQDGRVELANPTLEHMFGVQENGLIGRPVSTMFVTTVLDEWLVSRTPGDVRQASEPRTVTANRENGSTFLAELTITPRRIDDRAFLAITVRDVSERKQIQLRLKQQETLFEEVLDAIHIVDETGRIIYWNRGAATLFGYTAAEVIGKTSDDLLQITHFDTQHANVHAVDSGESDRWKGEVRARSAKNRPLRLDRRRTRIHDGDSVVGEVIIDLDVGERTRVEKLGRRRQRLEALGTLASGIAHDLNNLLTPILMSSNMLHRETPNLDRAAMLDTIIRSAKRGRELIAQLLTFARGGDGQHQVVSLDEIVNETLNIVIHTMPGNIDVKAEIDRALPDTFGDATEISQVLVNLAINARDAMIEGGRLTIIAKPLTLERERSYSFTTLSPGEYVAISVRDTGSGIPRSIREAIFDPFYSTKERGQGTGLGLSTSLGIIRSHDGAIEISSKVGVGTTMTVVLPVYNEVESSETEDLSNT